MTDNVPDTFSKKEKIPDQKDVNIVYNLDNSVEEQISQIKMEMNLIEFPIFTKNKRFPEDHSITYTFSESKNRYVRIVPTSDTKAISRKILQEHEELIFYALLDIYEKQNSRKIITDYHTLIKTANRDYNTYYLKRTRDALERLRKCEIQFNNVFYKAFNKESDNPVKWTTESVNLLDYLAVVGLKDVENLPEGDWRDRLENYLSGRQIKEIIILTLNQTILDNIESDGFRYFDSNKILSIDDSVARKLYLMLYKWGYMNGWKDLKRNCKFLSSRIPLRWTKNSRAHSIDIIERASNLLIEKNIIEGFTLNRKDPLGESQIIFKYPKKSRTQKLNESISHKSTGQEKLFGKVSKKHIEPKDDKELDLTEKQERKIDELSGPTTIQKKRVIELFQKHEEYEIDYMIYLLGKAVRNSHTNIISYFEVMLPDRKKEYDQYVQQLNNRKKHAEEIKKNSEKKKKIEKRKQKKAEEIYKKLSDNRIESIKQDKDLKLDIGLDVFKNIPNSSEEELIEMRIIEHIKDNLKEFSQEVE